MFFQYEVGQVVEVEFSDGVVPAKVKDRKATELGPVYTVDVGVPTSIRSEVPLVEDALSPKGTAEWLVYLESCGGLEEPS